MLVTGSPQKHTLSTYQTSVTDRLEEDKFLIFSHLTAGTARNQQELYS